MTEFSAELAGQSEQTQSGYSKIFFREDPESTSEPTIDELQAVLFEEGIVLNEWERNDGRLYWVDCAAGSLDELTELLEESGCYTVMTPARETYIDGVSYDMGIYNRRLKIVNQLRNWRREQP